MIRVGRELSRGIAHDVGRHLRDILADESGYQPGFGTAGEPPRQISADAFAHGSGHTTGNGPGPGSPKEAGRIEPVLAMAGGQLNALCGSIRARSDTGTDRRLRSDLGAHAHGETLGDESGTLRGDLG